MQATEWQRFLLDQGAVLDDGMANRFADPVTEATAVLEGESVAPLTHLGVIKVTGSDARQFLHSQFSNDVQNLKPDNWRLAAYCTAKGRALAVLRIFEIPDNTFYLILPREIIDATIKRLRMFVLMSQVTMEDISEQAPVIGASGDTAARTLEPFLAGKRLAHDNSVSVLKLGEQPPRYLLIGEIDGMQVKWNTLASSATKVGIPAWQLLDIHQGEPQVFRETVEAFVPQMLNMHAIDGISFKKGCYPGQEIVARMYYLGKLKRRMYLAHVDTDECPAPGQPLFAAHTDSGQGAGQVVLASHSIRGIDLLVVTPVSVVESGPLHLGSNDGPVLEILPLPYDVPLERASSQ